MPIFRHADEFWMIPSPFQQRLMQSPSITYIYFNYRSNYFNIHPSVQSKISASSFHIMLQTTTNGTSTFCKLAIKICYRQDFSD